MKRRPGWPPASPTRPRVHVDGGYCALGTKLAMDLAKVVEAKDAIVPSGDTRWTWRQDLCPTCRTRGGVLLFNRAVAEQNAFNTETEETRVTARREERRRGDLVRRDVLELKARAKAERAHARVKRSLVAAERRAAKIAQLDEKRRERDRERERKAEARRLRSTKLEKQREDARRKQVAAKGAADSSAKLRDLKARACARFIVQAANDTAGGAP